MWNRFRTPKNTVKKKEGHEVWNPKPIQLNPESSEYCKILGEMRADMKKSAKRISFLEESVGRSNVEKEAATMTSHCLARAIDKILDDMKKKETQLLAEKMVFKAIASAYAITSEHISS